MSTNIIIWIAVALLILGGGTYAAVSMKSSADTEGATATTTADTTANGNVTLRALLASGLPQKCEFTDVTAAAETSGTVYISGGSARGDFTATASGQTFHAHSITTSDTMYSWVEETGMGVKTAIDASASASSQSFDANKPLDYRCTPWVPDAAKFTVPTTVTFTTVNMGARGATGGGTSGSVGASAGANASVQASACAQCEMVPEAYRAQCKVAAGC